MTKKNLLLFFEKFANYILIINHGNFVKKKFFLGIIASYYSSVWSVNCNNRSHLSLKILDKNYSADFFP